MERKKEQSIGEILRQYLKLTQIENHVHEEQIAEIWQASLGNDIARETERIHLQGGILYVVLRSPSLKNEIMMQRTAIRTVLNEKMGAEIIKEVVVR